MSETNFENKNGSIKEEVLNKIRNEKNQLLGELADTNKQQIHQLNESLEKIIQDLISSVYLVDENDIDWNHLNENQQAMKGVADLIFPDRLSKNHSAYQSYLRLLAFCVLEFQDT